MDDPAPDADDVSVPPEATPHVCERCDRPFATASLLALHRGLAHPENLTEPDRDAFEEAREAEEADLRRFRLLALAALVALYFGFLMTYAVVT